MLTPADPLLYYGGAALCLGAIAWMGANGVAWRQDRTRQRRDADADAEAFRREAATAAGVAGARLSKRLAWRDRRPLRIADIVQENPRVRSFYLTDPEGKPLPRYLPGQHLTVALPIPDAEHPLLRCYSLSHCSNGDYYRLTVQREEAPSPGAPPGRGSNWLHDHAQIGHALPCEAPRGAFFLDPRKPKPTVLIGAGVGVTPVFAMLTAVEQAKWNRPVHAFFGHRDGEHHLFADPLRSLDHASEHWNVRVCFSRPRDDDRLGIDFQHRGRVTIDLLQDELPSPDFDFYVCGPPSLMQTLIPELLDWGVADDKIHYEAFGPASVSSPVTRSLCEQAIGSQVRFGPDDNPLTWDEESSTLLDLAESAGVPIASGCRAGSCGACRVRVVEGVTAPLQKPGTPVAEGECLACISVPKGHVLIET